MPAYIHAFEKDDQRHGSVFAKPCIVAQAFCESGRLRYVCISRGGARAEHHDSCLRSAAGILRGAPRELSVSARTVRAVLEQLERDEPLLYRNLCDETGKVRRHLNVFVNTENVRDLDGVDTTLAAGDVVTFLPAVSGG